MQKYKSCFKKKFWISYILNKLFFKFKKLSSTLCSFCKLEEETTLHFLHECIDTQTLLRQLHSFFNDSFPFPVSTTHSAIFVYVYKHWNELLINHLFLIFKIYMCILF